ncbi:MAG: cyclic nucleotide-binding domain-containing protein, partial [Candidatus Marinimicrobia bacterium]|nr:cyclic nucleotide-binding domain-containing protein [Candidatus Neomarinimicrobiota bacterium]HJL74181.1 cyclic nucleotide-binding domain-containing protein [Candidatus Neomarinimicrobiota bacterium]
LEKHLGIMIAGDKEWASAVATDFALKHQLTAVLKNVDWEKIKGSLALQEIVTKHDMINGVNEPLQKFKLDKEEFAMYSTLEKTILLKTVNLFQTIPTEDLSKVAQIAEEEQFGANIPLFAEGDFGDSLYIVVDGDVKIHKGDRHIASLGKGACLGEMALLDQEPRSADVTMETDATLLKITQEDFYEIMSSNMEIMQGIVKLLTGRLRDAIN